MIDKAREIAGGVVDGLKGNPLALGLIVINVLYLGAGLYIYRDQQARFGNAYRALFEQCIKKEGPAK